MKKLRVFEAFAGVGSQRRALELAKKDEYQIVGLAEWNVPAIIMYETIHNGLEIGKLIDIDRDVAIDYLNSKPLSMNSKDLVRKGYWNTKDNNWLKIAYTAVIRSEQNNNIFDIRKLKERGLSQIDLLTYSFPCQDLSIQGKQKGMKKNSGTRSGLLWEIEKGLENTDKKDLPKYLLMENVAALFNKNNAFDFKLWTDRLEKFGYINSYRILNSADFGSPQARKRAFMLSTLNQVTELPVGNTEIKNNIKSILDTKVDEKYFLKNLEQYNWNELRLTKSNIKRAILIDYTTWNSENYIYYPEYTGPTLTASGANSRIKIFDNNKIRKINPREAFKYMGFTDADYEKINKLNLFNDTQKIFAAGNSISIEVLKEIMKGIG